MAIFRTDLKSLDIPLGKGAIQIRGYNHVTEDPQECAVLRRNLGTHLWELHPNSKGEVEVKMVPKVKMVRGARTSEVQEGKEET